MSYCPLWENELIHATRQGVIMAELKQVSTQKTEKELPLGRIFYILLSRIYIVIIAFVIGACAGFGLAYYQYHDIDYYGATVDYRIEMHPIDDGVRAQYVAQYSENHLRTIATSLSLDETELIGEGILPGLKEEYESRLAAGKITAAQCPNIPTDENDPSFLTWVKNVKGKLSYSFDFSKTTNSVSMSVRVLNDPLFADVLLSVARVKVAEYIENHMIVASTGANYVTDCKEFNYVSSGLISAGQKQNAYLKDIAIGAVALALVACALLIYFELSDARIRDYQQFSAQTGIPVLGVIPKAHISESALHSGYGYGYGYGYGKKHRSHKSEKNETGNKEEK